MGKTLIALISATPAAIPPAVRAFGEEFPEALVWNILDDRLLVDADKQGVVTPGLRARMVRLINHAVTERANGILLTCSMFGFVAHETDVGVPTYAPDDAAFDDVIAAACGRVLVVGSLSNPLNDAVARFRQVATRAGVSTVVESVVAEGAYDAALAGDDPSLLDLLLRACRPASRNADAVLLAQYSLSPVAARLAADLGVPVFSGPLSAARMLRSQLLVGN
jgi:Asp/Glu/hydantoin racemase